MRILLAPVLSILTVTCCLAQQPVFQASYGTSAWERFRSIAPTSDGGFIAAGESSGFGNGNLDMYIIKTDSLGDTLWTSMLGGSNSDWAASVQEVTPGAYLVTGSTTSFGSGADDVYVALLNSTGDTIFTRAYGDADPQYIVANSTKAEKTFEGGYIIAATAYDSGYTAMHIYIIKTDSAGNQVWAKKYAGPGIERAWAIQKTADTTYLITGVASNGSMGTSDVFLLKIDGNGNVIWGKTYDSAASEEGVSLTMLGNGDCVIFGTTTSNNSNGYSEMMLMRVDPNGTLLWSKVYESNGNMTYANSVITDVAGNLVLAGSIRTPANDFSALAFKTDGSGNLQWAKELTGAGTYDSYMCAGRCLDGTYVFAGATDTYGAGSADGLISRIGPGGESACGMTIPLITVVPATLSSAVFAPAISNLGVASGTASGRFYSGFPIAICMSHVDINDITETADINVWPNPARSTVNISLETNSSNQLSIVSICDVLGNQVHLTSLTNAGTTIDVSTFVPGIYILQINCGDQISRTKFIVE